MVSSVEQVEAVVAALTQSRMKHRLHGTADYVTRPKVSGYRSVHLIYHYKGSRTTSYDGLRIEVQVRSALQHAWATAVETVDLFEGKYMKVGVPSIGWDTFFRQMSGLIAAKEQRLPSGAPTFQELKRQINADEMVILAKRLLAYNVASRFIEPFSNAHYYLIKIRLGTPTPTVGIAIFTRQDSEAAHEAYFLAEKDEVNAVLVSVDSMEALKKAYPNYFADLGTFLLVFTEASQG